MTMQAGTSTCETQFTRRNGSHDGPMRMFLQMGDQEFGRILGHTEIEGANSPCAGQS